MQIRGEAAIACGFMAGLATGLLFDGCFDSYINRFRDPVFREVGFKNRSQSVKRWPRRPSPTAWILQKSR